jgi:hypothetical protein
MKSSAKCFGVMLAGGSVRRDSFSRGGNSLAADCRSPREHERKNLTFSFPRPGFERGMFFAEAPKKETATRGGARKKRHRKREGAGEPSFPLLPLGAFSVGCGRTFRKICKIKTV